MENNVYNPDKINIEALKLFLASLMCHDTGDYAINPDEVDDICRMFKELVKAYIAKPDIFEHNDRPCNYNCKYIGQLIDFESKGKICDYYCRIQNNCPIVDDSCICPYNNDEERQYAENLIKLQSNLNLMINQNNNNSEDPTIE